MNKDHRVGIEEAFSVLQVASGIRSETVISDPMESTLENVKAKGFIQVGVNGNLLGFSKTDEKGIWRGLDVECARAVSVAIFSDPDKLKFTPLTAQNRFTALQLKEIDVLFRNVTHTLGRDISLGISFVAVNYYDGQGILVQKNLGVNSAKELDGTTVCVIPGTTSEMNVADYFKTNGMEMTPFIINNSAQLASTFYAGNCDCLTSDVSQLASIRAVATSPDDYMILPEIISKEPLAPAVRNNDYQWRGIVNYSVLAMINAEELGINSKNVDEMLNSDNPTIKRHRLERSHCLLRC